MNNNFDFVLCVLACAKNDKYKNRIKNFINEYGFKLINNDLKIKIVFLAEDEPRPDFIPNNFDWENFPDTPLSLRLINYIKRTDLNTQWLMQVDDDSSTDIDKTVEFLNYSYDFNDNMLLMGGRNTDLEMGLQIILRKMNIQNFLFNSLNITQFETKPYFIHAWEPSIFSKKALLNIKNYPRLEEFDALCRLYKPIFSDQAPYVLARLAKIPIVECLFLSSFNSVHEYTGINSEGRFSHIHYVIEGTSEYQKLISLMKNEKNIRYEYNNLWEFWAHDLIPNKERFIGILSLEKDFSIGGYDNFNEKFWSFKNNKIYLYDGNKKESSILEKNAQENLYEGFFLRNKNIIHKLKKLK